MRTKLKLRALMWKNFLVRYRQSQSVFCEIVLPVLVLGVTFLVMSYTRYLTGSIKTFEPDSDMLEVSNSSDIIFHFCPVNALTEHLVSHVVVRHNVSEKPPVGFPDVMSYIKSYIHKGNTPFRLPLVVFDSITPEMKDIPKHLSYHILDLNYSLQSEHFLRTFHSMGKIGPDKSEIIMVQKIITEMFISTWKMSRGQPRVNLNISSQIIPLSMDFVSTILYINAVGYAIIFSYVPISFNMMRILKYEMEINVKEFFLLLDVSPWVYWMSWYLIALMGYLVVETILFLIGICLSAIILLLTTSPLVVYMILILYAVNSVTFCFLTVNFTGQADTKTLVTSVLVPFVLYIIASESVAWMSGVGQVLLGITIFQFAFYMNLNAIILREQHDERYGIADIFQYPTVSATTEINLSCGILLLVCNSVFNILCTIYFHKIKPAKYADTLSPLFFLKKLHKRTPSQVPVSSCTGSNSSVTHVAEYIDADDTSLLASIVFDGVIKCTNRQVIISETTLKLFDSQITVILGPASANKSALVGLITGLQKATSGNIFVYEKNVAENRKEVQENIGLVPNTDIFFKNLTCSEHLKLCSQLKGIGLELEESKELLAGINLEDKFKVEALRLSPYEKRLLAIATATLGDPRVIILDEPSRDLNLSERKSLIAFLKTLCLSRTIIVTTADLPEAEALEDRLAIIVDGDVKCYGSVEFLKKAFGVGYQLSILKQEGCQSELVTDMIKELIPHSSLLDENDKELRYALPPDGIYKMTRLLSELEARSDLKIEKLALYTVTMDEIFDRVLNGYDPKTNARRSLSTTSRKSASLISLQDEESQSQTSSGFSKHQRKTYFLGKQKPSFIKKKHVQIHGILARETSDSLQETDPSSEVDDKNTNMRRQVDDRAGLELSRFEVAPNTSSPDLVGTSLNSPREETYRQAKVAEKSVLASRPDSILKRLGSSDSLEAYVNLGLQLLPLLHKKEYVFRKNYSLNPDGPSKMQKINTICFQHALVTKYHWIVTLLQLSIPWISLLLGLLLDLSSSNPETYLTFEYGLNKSSGTEVTIFTSNQTKPILVSLYSSLVAHPHKFYIQSTDGSEKGVAKVLLQWAMATGRSRDLVGVDFSQKRHKDGIALFSLEGSHTKATSMQLLLNSHIKNELGTDYSVSSGLMTIENMPELNRRPLLPATTLGLTLGLVFFPLAAVRVLFFDRSSRRKDVLEMYGISPELYWLCRLFWDMILYSVVVVGLILLLFIRMDIFILELRGFVVVLVLYLFGLAFLCHVYLLQPIFSLTDNSVLLTLGIQIVAGVFGSFMLLFSEFISSNTVERSPLIKLLAFLLQTLSPIYSLTSVFLSFAVQVPVNPNDVSFLAYFEVKELNGVQVNLTKHIIILLLQFLLFFLATIWSDSRVFKYRGDPLPVASRASVLSEASSFKSFTRSNQELALLQEKLSDQVFEKLHESDALYVHHLHKSYEKTMVVDGLDLSLKSTDCFGLLGPSKSGKTTTLLLLAGMEPMSSGCVCVRGVNLAQHTKKVQRLINFTPRFDFLLENLTGSETLFFYGSLRGIPSDSLGKEVYMILYMLGLENLADTSVAIFSFSQKRLLAIGVSFLGKPAVIMLDEPTSGLGYEEKNLLWSLMVHVKESKTAILFTSQSVEECEMVCTNMAIQVAGKIECMGSPKELKSKFTVGYTVFLFLRHDMNLDEMNVPMLVENMVSRFPGAVVIEKNRDFLSFRLPHTGRNLIQVFGTLKLLKRKFKLQNYLVHETTLEQVYLSFVKGSNLRPVWLVPKKRVRWADIGAKTGMDDMAAQNLNRQKFLRRHKSYDLDRFLSTRLN